MKLIVIVVGGLMALIVVGTVVFELVGWFVERKARERLDKMTPDDRFKFQNEMRKRQL